MTEQTAQYFENVPPIEVLSTDARIRGDQVILFPGVMADAVLFEARDQEVAVSNGRRLQYVTYFDGTPERKALTDTITTGRQRRYKEEHLLKSEAKDQDNIRGDNVEFVALLESDTEDPAINFRKVHAFGVEGLTKMPSYRKCAESGSFSSDGLALLCSRTANRPVVEIAGLWKSTNYDTDAKLALYRLALQDSVRKGELWFMGTVATERAALQRAYGSAIHILGEPTLVKGEDAERGVTITPMLVDPETFYDDLIDDIETARMMGDYSTADSREMMLWEFLRGLEWQRYLRRETVQRITAMLPNETTLVAA